MILKLINNYGGEILEFNEKLQELRKQKGLTQEELAQILYVSRTAISKWESGRGYPNIESLKAISKFFSISIDELLSSEEILTIAEEDNKQKENHFYDLVLGLLDCSIAMLFFLPLFGQKVFDSIQVVPLFALTDIQLYLKIIYFIVVFITLIFGIMTLALQNCNNIFWLKNKNKFSLLLSVVAVLLFIITQQPYAAVYAFGFLIIKAWITIKKR